MSSYYCLAVLLLLGVLFPFELAADPPEEPHDILLKRISLRDLVLNLQIGLGIKIAYAEGPYNPSKPYTNQDQLNALKAIDPKDLTSQEKALIKAEEYLFTKDPKLRQGLSNSRQVVTLRIPQVVSTPQQVASLMDKIKSVVGDFDLTLSNTTWVLSAKDS